MCAEWGGIYLDSKVQAEDLAVAVTAQWAGLYLSSAERV